VGHVPCREAAAALTAVSSNDTLGLSGHAHRIQEAGVGAAAGHGRARRLGRMRSSIRRDSCSRRFRRFLPPPPHAAAQRAPPTLCRRCSLLLLLLAGCPSCDRTAAMAAAAAQPRRQRAVPCQQDRIWTPGRAICGGWVNTVESQGGALQMQSSRVQRSQLP
jgi:hypothetical protein